MNYIPAMPFFRNDIKSDKDNITCWEFTTSGNNNIASYRKVNSSSMYTRHGMCQYYTTYNDINYIITVKYNFGLPEGVTIFQRGLSLKVIATFSYITRGSIKILSNKPLEQAYQVLPSRYAYVCLLMKGDSYLPGLQALSASIYNTQTNNDFVVMITSDVTRNKVEKYVTRAVDIDYLQFESKQLRTAKQQDLYSKWFSISYTKWNSLKLVEYDKIILLDLDIVVLENLDHLFIRSAPAGTFSMPWAYPYVKEGKSQVYNPYINIKDNEVIPKSAIEIGLNGFRRKTEQGGKQKYKSFDNEHSFVLIATTVLLKPSIQDFNDYITMMNKNQPFGYPNCNSMFDEQSIALFYNSVDDSRLSSTGPVSRLSSTNRWHMISQRYNMIPWHSKVWLPKGEKAAVYHFFGKEKPWEMKKEEWPDLKVWWKYYEMSSQI
jgi:alpha-N-acetylglucosamine transferase